MNGFPAQIGQRGSGALLELWSKGITNIDITDILPAHIGFMCFGPSGAAQSTGSGPVRCRTSSSELFLCGDYVSMLDPGVVSGPRQRKVEIHILVQWIVQRLPPCAHIDIVNYDILARCRVGWLLPRTRHQVRRPRRLINGRGAEILGQILSRPATIRMSMCQNVVVDLDWCLPCALWYRTTGIALHQPQQRSSMERKALLPPRCCFH